MIRKVYTLAEVPLLSESYWRQICTSIVKMKFGADRKCFDVLTDRNVEDDKDNDDDDSEDEEAATLVRISNYIVRIHNRTYANETSLVSANI